MQRLNSHQEKVWRSDATIGALSAQLELLALNADMASAGQDPCPMETPHLDAVQALLQEVGEAVSQARQVSREGRTMGDDLSRLNQRIEQALFALESGTPV